MHDAINDKWKLQCIAKIFLSVKKRMETAKVLITSGEISTAVS